LSRSGKARQRLLGGRIYRLGSWGSRPGHVGLRRDLALHLLRDDELSVVSTKILKILIPSRAKLGIVLKSRSNIGVLSSKPIRLLDEKALPRRAGPGVPVPPGYLSNEA
jgi:hypothetical protein